MSSSTSEKPANQKINAQLVDYQKPEKLSALLKEDKYDCLSCRLTGERALIALVAQNLMLVDTCSAAFLGLGAYVYWSGSKALNERRAEIIKKGARVGLRGRMAGLTLLSSSLAALGAYRLIN